MFYCIIISLSFYFFLYSIPLYSKIFNFNIDKPGIINSLYTKSLDSSINEYYFEGGYNYNKIVNLPKKEIMNWFNNKPVCVNLVGFINTHNDIIFNDKYNNTLIIGNKDIVSFNHSYIEGNNKNINGLKNILLDSWDSLTLKNFTINDLSNFTFNHDAYNHNLENIKFINNHDLNFNVFGPKVNLNNITFCMLKDSNLRLNFLINKDTNILGDDIKIEGSKSSKAYINFLAKDKLVIKLSGISSKINTLLNFNKVNLIINREIKLFSKDNEISIYNSTVKGKINLLEDNNRLDITNSIIQGSIIFNSNKNYLNVSNSIISGCVINFYGTNNEVVLNNFVANKNSELCFCKDNNKINVNGNFSGKLNFLSSYNKLNFKDSIIDNSEIHIKDNTNLYFLNTVIKDVAITTNGYENNMYFNNTLSTAELTFNNSNINLICEEGSNNVLGGKLTINKNSTVNITLKDNSVLEVNYVSNKPINNFVFSNSCLVIGKYPFIVDSFIQKGNNEILVDLNNKLDCYIHSKNANFDNYVITLKTYNTNIVLPKNNDQISIVLLKSDTRINKLRNIILNNNLLKYEVIYKDKKIILNIKKVRKFIDLIDYNPQVSIFDKNKLIDLANYLDILWERDNLPILDKASKTTTNSKDYLVFLNSVFPVSNNILYKSSYETMTTFSNIINNIESNCDLKSKVWSNFYNLRSNFTLGNNNHMNLTLNGKGMATGIDRKLNSFCHLGLVAGLSLNKLEEFNYDINFFNYNSGIYSKINLKNKFHNTTSLVLSFNNFNLNRKVFYSNYNNINKSSPKNISYAFNNESKYKVQILNYSIYNYSLLPKISLTLGKVNIPNYKEQGEEALSIQGCDVFMYTLESGINSLLNINFKSYRINTKIGFNVGYNYNNLKSTKFRFKDSKLLNTVELTDFYKSNIYFKTHIGVSCINVKDILGINLSFDYTTSKLFNSANINISGFIKI